MNTKDFSILNLSYRDFPRISAGRKNGRSVLREIFANKICRGGAWLRPNGLFVLAEVGPPMADQNGIGAGNSSASGGGSLSFHLC
jgi:hypothetical protein